MDHFGGYGFQGLADEVHRRGRNHGRQTEEQAGETSGGIFALQMFEFAEEGFDPHTDVDTDCLRFSAPEKVDFGNGCKPVKSEKSGKDLVVTFDAAGNGITGDNFAAKLIGRTTRGKLLFGYSRLPGVDYSPYVARP